MKTILLSLAVMMSVSMGTATAQRTLIVYFSHSGNTQAVANEIKSLTGADIFRIEPVKAYPEEYRKCTEVAKEEKNNNARPAIKGKIENIDRYDTVFIGFPIWWGTYPMAVATFLDQYDLAGKTVIPFCTHEGSRQGQSFTDLIQRTPKSANLEGLAVIGSKANSSRADVETWLRKIKIIN